MLYRGRPILGIQSAKNTVINSKRGNNVQDVVDSIDKEKKGKWTKIGEVTNTTPLAIPSGYSEFHIVVRYNAIMMTADVVKEDIEGITNEQVRMGYYLASNNHVCVIVNVNADEFHLNSVQVSGSSVISSSRLVVYGR